MAVEVRPRYTKETRDLFRFNDVWRFNNNFTGFLPDNINEELVFCCRTQKPVVLPDGEVPLVCLALSPKRWDQSVGLPASSLTMANRAWKYMKDNCNGIGKGKPFLGVFANDSKIIRTDRVPVFWIDKPVVRSSESLIPAGWVFNNGRSWRKMTESRKVSSMDISFRIGNYGQVRWSRSTKFLRHEGTNVMMMKTCNNLKPLTPVEIREEVTDEMIRMAHNLAVDNIRSH